MFYSIVWFIFMVKFKIMTKLALLNGKEYDIKESIEDIGEEISRSIVWIRLTLVLDNLSSNPIEKQARFMIAAIAYCY